MKINFKCFLGLLFVLFVQIVSAQEIKVTGKVTDKTGMPVPGANINIKGTKTNVETGFDGQFDLNAKQGETLVVSFIGMRTIEVSASPNVAIKLQDATNELETVLVIGYGTTSKRKSTSPGPRNLAPTPERATRKGEGRTLAVLNAFRWIEA